MNNLCFSCLLIIMLIIYNVDAKILFTVSCASCSNACQHAMCFRLTSQGGKYDQSLCGPVSCSNAVLFNQNSISLNFSSCARDYTGKLCQSGVCLIKSLASGCQAYYQNITTGCPATNSTDTSSISCEQCLSGIQCTKCLHTVTVSDSQTPQITQNCIGSYCPDTINQVQYIRYACSADKTSSCSCCYNGSSSTIKNDQLYVCTNNLGLFSGNVFNAFIRVATRWGSFQINVGIWLNFVLVTIFIHIYG